MLAGCFFTAWMGQLAHLLKDTCDWRLVALARSSLAFGFALGLTRLSGANPVFWGPGALWLHGTKADVLAAALPASRTPELLDTCRPLLPMLSAADSVLHTGLTNLGAILHPVITLLNAERIRRGDSFDFYTEGVTPAVAATLADADAERLRPGSTAAVRVPCARRSPKRKPSCAGTPSAAFRWK